MCCIIPGTCTKCPDVHFKRIVYYEMNISINVITFECLMSAKHKNKNKFKYKTLILRICFLHQNSLSLVNECKFLAFVHGLSADETNTTNTAIFRLSECIHVDSLSYCKVYVHNVQYSIQHTIKNSPHHTYFRS